MRDINYELRLKTDLNHSEKKDTTSNSKPRLSTIR